MALVKAGRPIVTEAAGTASKAIPAGSLGKSIIAGLGR